MQKPRLVITASGLHDLQSRILNQYYNTGKVVKYASALTQYQSMVDAGSINMDIITPKPLELAL